MHAHQHITFRVWRSEDTRKVILSFHQLGSANSAHQVQQKASSPPEPPCCLQNTGTLNFQLSGSKIYAWKQWKLLDKPYYIILDSVHSIQIFYE